jgi:TonB family protein
LVLGLLMLAFGSAAGAAQQRISGQQRAPLPDIPESQIVAPAPDVQPPVPLFAPNAGYTDSGRRAEYNGTVRVTFVVDAQGNPRNMELERDLPYGLGDAARQAVSTWRFRPAMQNGKPVAYRGAVEMSFRLQQEANATQHPAYLTRAQRLDRVFAHLQQLQQPAAKLALAELEQLVQDRYPPAVFHLGKLLLDGEVLPKDLKRAKALLDAAAADLEPDALAYQWEHVFNAATAVPVRVQAVRHMEKLRALGSLEAELWLALLYWEGNVVAPNLEEARQRMRACAVRGGVACLRVWMTLELEFFRLNAQDQLEMEPARRQAVYTPCPDLQQHFAAADAAGSRVARALLPELHRQCAILSANPHKLTLTPR